MPVRRAASILLLAWWLVLPAATAGEQWLLYDGTFYDVTFPPGQREVKTLRIEVYVPRPVQNAPSPGPSGTVRITNPQGGQPPLDYRIRNAYVSSDISLYLATHGESSVVLRLPGASPGATADVPTEGMLLFSDREGARTVKGTRHPPPPMRKR